MEDWLRVEPQEGVAGITGVKVSVLSVNEGLDRKCTLQVVCGDTSAPFRVNQVGKREVFLAADGDFLLSNGQTFNVLKKHE